MSGGRNYSAGTPIALATLCNDTCYWPDALARFAETDSEAAALLKGLIEELNDLHRRPILDEGIVNQLSEAAKRLNLDEGLIKQLHEAATKMWRIQGNM